MEATARCTHHTRSKRRPTQREPVFALAAHQSAHASWAVAALVSRCTRMLTIAPPFRRPIRPGVAAVCCLPSSRTEPLASSVCGRGLRLYTNPLVPRKNRGTPRFCGGWTLDDETCSVLQPASAVLPLSRFFSASSIVPVATRVQPPHCTCNAVHRSCMRTGLSDPQLPSRRTRRPGSGCRRHRLSCPSLSRFRLSDRSRRYMDGRAPASNNHEQSQRPFEGNPTMSLQPQRMQSRSLPAATTQASTQRR